MSNLDIQHRVEAYIAKQQKWTSALSKLRSIFLSTELEENVKWGMPSYEINGKNVIGIAGFKNHFGIWFHNGVFLEDKKGLLQNAQEGKTKAMRQMRFESETEIDDKVVLHYVLEAIQNQKDGKELKPAKPQKKKKLEVPEILKKNLKGALKTNFEKLTIAAQNEYIEYITSAKREATKISRLEKILPLIEDGQRLSALWS